jgi:hypothetical protein
MFVKFESAQIGPMALNVVCKSAQIGPVAQKWLKTLESSLSKDDLCQVWLKLAQ